MSSHSTLIRRAKAAEKAGHKRSAANLRRQANQLRRKTRRKYPLRKPAPANKILKGLQQGVALTDAQTGWKVSENQVGFGNLPGKGEIVGALPGNEGKDPVHRMTDDRLKQILEFAKKKDDGSIGIILRAVAVEAMREGRSRAGDEFTARLHQAIRSASDAHVKSFLSLIEQLEKLHNGLPKTVMLTGPMAACLVDALREAGWTSDSAPARAR